MLSLVIQGALALAVELVKDIPMLMVLRVLLSVHLELIQGMEFAQLPLPFPILVPLFLTVLSMVLTAFAILAMFNKETHAYNRVEQQIPALISLTATSTDNTVSAIKDTFNKETPASLK